MGVELSRVRDGWIYTGVLLSVAFFLMDELFIFGLAYVPAELRLTIHRGALFIVVAAFIFYTQLALSRLRSTNMQLLHSGRLSALGEMSAMFAHELIRPLTKLDMFVQIELNNKDIEPGLQRFCLDVTAQLERAKHLIHSLRSFGYASSDSARVVHGVQELIEEALIVTEPYLAYVKLSKELPQEKLQIKCNQYQIEQVLANLLINARDALEGCREKCICLQARRREGWAEITVMDTGSGIGVKDIKRIFDPFYTTKGLGKGTGLGLAISRKIMMDHGGGIVVESRPGRTEFILQLPLVNQI